MSKVISARDLLLADPLKGMNQFDLCTLENMEKVHDVLAVLGFDVTKAVHVYAANHRDMQNKVDVGFIFAGEYSYAREHINGPYSTLADLMLAAQAQDKSLYEELHTMNSRCATYGGEHALDDSIPNRDDEEYKEEENRISAQIAQLEELLYHIRGEQRNADGSWKTLEDYRFPKPAEKRRKKHVHRNKNVKEGSVDD